MRYLRHYLQQFLNDVRRQRLRTALTLFGIVWGTASVTLLLAFGAGLHQRILTNIKGLGENIVICWPARTSKVWEGLPKGRRIQLTEEDVERLRAEVPLMARLSGEFALSGRRVSWRRQSLAPQIVGANHEFGEMRNLVPAAGGRGVNLRDLAQRRRVVFLGDKLASDLFGEAEGVGQQVMIGGVPFLVVGTMVPKQQDSNYSGRDTDKATIPISTYRALFGERYVDNFIFQVADVADVEAAKRGVIAALARSHHFDPGDREALYVWDTTENLKFMNSFFVGFRVFLGVMGALTLVVGGIGVSNIMNVVVEERTKEIGLKMALGATSRYVVNQILFETLLLTAAGGLAGLAIAWGVCAAFPSFGAESFVGTPRISLQVAATTAAILGVIGVAAGAFPARGAARLNPVEALRL